MRQKDLFLGCGAWHRFKRGAGKGRAWISYRVTQMEFYSMREGCQQSVDDHPFTEAFSFLDDGRPVAEQIANDVDNRIGMPRNALGALRLYEEGTDPRAADMFDYIQRHLPHSYRQFYYFPSQRLTPSSLAAIQPEGVMVLDRGVFSPLAYQYRAGKGCRIMSFGQDMGLDNGRTIQRWGKWSVELLHLEFEWEGELAGDTSEVFEEVLSHAPYDIDFAHEEALQKFDALLEQIANLMRLAVDDEIGPRLDDPIMTESRQIEYAREVLARPEFTTARGQPQEMIHALQQLQIHAGLDFDIQVKAGFGTEEERNAMNGLHGDPQIIIGLRDDAVIAPRHREIMGLILTHFWPEGKCLGVFAGNRKSDARESPAVVRVKSQPDVSAHDRLAAYGYLKAFLKERALSPQKVAGLLR